MSKTTRGDKLDNIFDRMSNRLFGRPTRRALLGQLTPEVAEATSWVDEQREKIQDLGSVNVVLGKPHYYFGLPGCIETSKPVDFRLATSLAKCDGIVFARVTGRYKVVFDMNYTFFDVDEVCANVLDMIAKHFKEDDDG